MHLYAYLQRVFPDWLAGVLFALIYAAMVVATLVLAQLVPAEFDYGRY